MEENATDDPSHKQMNFSNVSALPTEIKGTLAFCKKQSSTHKFYLTYIEWTSIISKIGDVPVIHMQYYQI